MSSKLENMLRQLKDAQKRFKDVMKKEKDEYIRDSAIKRFEFTFESAWKAMKVYLEEKGVKVYAPRDIIKSAFQVKIIPEDTLWLDMLEIRNLTSHIYNEKIAETVYSKLSSCLPLIDNLIKELS